MFAVRPVALEQREIKTRSQGGVHRERRMRAVYVPWVAVPLNQCAVIGCRRSKGFEHRNGRDIARRYCEQHAREYDREIASSHAGVSPVVEFPHPREAA
jgi:hypothetical protein